MLSTPPYKWLFYDPGHELQDLLLKYHDIAVNFTVLSLLPFSVSIYSSTAERRQTEDQPLHTVPLKGRTAKVVMIEERPFTMKKRDWIMRQGNDRFQGFAVDLIEEVAQMLDFNYEIYLVHDGNFGSRQANGEWNGMIGELLAGVDFVSYCHWMMMMMTTTTTTTMMTMTMMTMMMMTTTIIIITTTTMLMTTITTTTTMMIMTTTTMMMMTTTTIMMMMI
nr:hypothetical protein BaRGS_017995 [Batillaria attramentaria]